MRLAELHKILGNVLKREPHHADAEVLVDRWNGKRTRLLHTIDSVGHGGNGKTSFVHLNVSEGFDGETPANYHDRRKE